MGAYVRVYLAFVAVQWLVLGVMIINSKLYEITSNLK